MQYLFDAADHWLKKSDWKDIAVLKFCLLSIGLIAGAQIPKKHKETAQIAALGIFLVTYIPLMAKFFDVLLNPPVPEEGTGTDS